MRTKLLVALVLVLLVATNVAQAGNQLWTQCVPQANEVRCRYVEMVVSHEQLHVGAVLNAPLFGNAKYRLKIESVQDMNGWKLYSGSVRNNPDSPNYFYILDAGTSYFIHVETSSGNYHVEMLESGLYKIVQEKQD